MLSDLAKKVLYGSGLLGLYHRLRNRRTLTVIMFHRVLDPVDPRWASCDPDYTLDAGLLERCLAFFRRHYRLVSVDDVLAARREGRALPARALLVTFDDGWSDNVDFALPRLARAGVPGLLFVVADVIGRRLAFFQERLVGALRLGKLRVADLAAALPSSEPAVEGIGGLRRVIGRLESLDEESRERVLAPFATAMDDGLRHMVVAGELRTLENGGIAIGLHGKTHTPMTRVNDLDAELGGARRAVAPHLSDGRAPVTMSFPHGRYDAAIAARAREAGYELVFTSDPVLNPTDPQPGWLLGRVGFEQAGIVDARGRFRADHLALLLFRTRRTRLVKD
ncbi:MAG TPA: polysaccharide deacetylase family protein [Dokdonella sp.]|uniref:polysaccharide deacetylase family protein n=1 Tax=Dokdonella sp. TaxID=2291710 RepID=UPI0025C6D082|nr:polysaccharide deacetylase family protein [Dokdonella sp.]MBX3691653.1 polysaccharide deacetylase family protein [Dokdonella sp.]MCW5567386.1 polysaccharide deacetylase family protein [Dokdonella sp.]HNR91631.1 polysaccharide deacetylase family protein [Dokdonella sp.]